MKAMVDFPDGIFHIHQSILKRVRALDDVADRYATDPRWMHQDKLARLSCSMILPQIAGKPASVLMAWRGPSAALMYGILLDEPVTAPNEAGITVLHDRCQFPADYFEVINMGFCEGK